MRRFGIMAHSAEGAALCFLTFCREGFASQGAHMHPDVALDCAAMGHSMAAWASEDYAIIRETLAQSVDRLAAAGCSFFACPDNTAHIALETTGRRLALPGLHIADVVAHHAAAKGMRRVGILGTRFTMMGPVYPRALGAEGIACEVPDEDERRDIDTIIFDELVMGRFSEAARHRYLEIIERLRIRGCDGVALVCTEIPLLISPDVSPLPVLDSTRLLARAAYAVSVGDEDLPSWHGGPA